VIESPESVTRDETDELIELLENLIRIPSCSGQEESLSKFIVAYGESLGFSTLRQTEHWDIAGTLEGEHGGPTILLLTHMDHSPPEAEEDPYRAAVMDGSGFGKPGRVMVGKGSCSPKATLACMLYACKRIALKKKEMKGSVILAAVGRDLLANHDGIRALVEKGWIHADFAIAGEPTGNEPKIGARGINHIEIVIPGSPSHWGRPDEGINPVWQLSSALQILHELIRELPRHGSLKGATLVPIDISCQMKAPRTPSACHVLLDRRTLPGEDPEAILREIEERLRQGLPEHQVRASMKNQMYAYEGDPATLICRKIAETNDRLSGRPVPFGYLSFATNGAFLTHRMKIPTVVYGPGRIEDMAPKEHVEIDRLVLASRVYTETILGLLH
jgi:succinyl-diaminopimelate desuccinylase